MKSESTELALFASPLVPAVIFAEGGVDAILGKIKAEVAAVEIDISTPAGRRECASLAYKVARSKTALDDMGKELGEGHYRAWKGITSERARLVRELDILKDEVRRPLTDWENADKERIAAHEAAIEALIESPAFYAAENPAVALRQRLSFLGGQPPRDWQEFAKRATDALSSEIAKTKVSLAEAEAREAAIAEAARIAIEKAEAERRAHDAVIAENARREAEAKAAAIAKTQAERVEREKREAEERAAAAAAEAALKAKAEQDRIASEARIAAENAQREREAVEAERLAAEERARLEREARIAAEVKAKADAEAATHRAEAERLAAAEKAERDKQAAIEAERKRVSAAREREAAEIASREANKRHRAAVHNEILSDLIAATEITDAAARAVITAIVSGKVRHTKVSY